MTTHDPRVALQLVAKHRRHVELSPGVGEDVQRYALAVLDDLAADFTLTPAPAEDVDLWRESFRTGAFNRYRADGLTNAQALAAADADVERIAANFTAISSVPAPAEDVRKAFIVWNPERNEGFVTTDRGDARWTATGRGGRFGVPTLGEAFREAYDDGGDRDEFKIEEISVSNFSRPDEGRE
jgi:hypothetical protein